MRVRSLYHENLYYGDIVMVNYGKNRDGRMTIGIKPSVIVSTDNAIKNEKYIYVIPLYRKIKSFHKTDSIFVKKNNKNGLRYDEYVQPMFLQRIHKERVSSILGYISDQKLMENISDSIGSMFNDLERR